MAKLTCVAISRGNAFSVVLNGNLTVADLKTAINDKKQFTDASQIEKIQVFMAKTKDGEWLKPNDPDVIKMRSKVVSDRVKELLKDEQDPRKSIGDLFEGAPTAETIHVLVKVPGEIFFSWCTPKPLVETEGAQWDFQNPLDNNSIASAVRCHYQAWKADINSSQMHPLFLIRGARGTGKSRMLDEFPTLVKEHLFQETEDTEILRLLKNAFTFKIPFENETAENFQFAYGGHAIGARMLFQLQNEMPWPEFSRKTAHHQHPTQVMSMLSTITGTAERDMCVVLCVDNLQKLQHESGNYHSEFDSALDTLCDVVNASKCWVIAICSTTIYTPVVDFLLRSSQRIYQAPTSILSRPKVQNFDVFEEFGDDEVTQRLLDDMSGYASAVETLYRVLSARAKTDQSMEFTAVMADVLAALHAQFPAIRTEVESLKRVSMTVIARRRVDTHSRFGDLSLDDVLSIGLVRLEGEFLECPYVLHLLLHPNIDP